MKNKFFQNEIRGTLNLLTKDKLRAIICIQHKNTKLDWPAIVKTSPFITTKTKRRIAHLMHKSSIALCLKF